MINEGYGARPKGVFSVSRDFHATFGGPVIDGTKRKMSRGTQISTDQHRALSQRADVMKCDDREEWYCFCEFIGAMAMNSFYLAREHMAAQASVWGFGL